LGFTAGGWLFPLGWFLVGDMPSLELKGRGNSGELQLEKLGLCVPPGVCAEEVRLRKTFSSAL
jgi:hypothetical protein